MTHSHITKVLEFELDEKANYRPSLFGCTDCDETSKLPFITDDIFSDHREHISYTDGCFACKVLTLELNTGDAGRADAKMSQRKWDKELYAYEDARKQGIQPAGTSMAQINAAYQASDTLGAAYNADVMPSTDKITKSSIEGLKHTGDI